jgi:hypothetical protein
MMQRVGCEVFNLIVSIMSNDGGSTIEQNPQLDNGAKGDDASEPGRDF